MLWHHTEHSTTLLLLLFACFPAFPFSSPSVYNNGINGTAAFLKRYAKCHAEIHYDIRVSAICECCYFTGWKKKKKTSEKSRNGLEELSVGAFEHSLSTASGLLCFDTPVDFWAVSERPLEASTLADDLKFITFWARGPTANIKVTNFNRCLRGSYFKGLNLGQI